MSEVTSSFCYAAGRCGLGNAVGATVTRYVIEETLSEIAQLAFAYSSNTQQRSG